VTSVEGPTKPQVKQEPRTETSRSKSISAKEPKKRGRQQGAAEYTDDEMLGIVQSIQKVLPNEPFKWDSVH
jgi:hypothetical protein